jgi:hypothetical protein
MTVIANTLVGWLRLTVSMLLLFSGLFIILCFSTMLASLNFHEWRVPIDSASMISRPSLLPENQLGIHTPEHVVNRADYLP